MKVKSDVQMRHVENVYLVKTKSRCKFSFASVMLKYFENCTLNGPKFDQWIGENRL